ncbi:uncharacterized protein E5676_scaffold1159G00180 [Cucumis melo var. makuwa]|uniref:Reverse transcriptase zinc-binding domain-containing protein n=1 Tax=Cucumis melo var. makuwa TaxID=1194695 RepID=A0A5D3BDR5_CUCMM|nr:uncharacterized protein E5676_scaffold1159G00180 [Cucumis melo var. makuwa]
MNGFLDYVQEGDLDMRDRFPFMVDLTSYEVLIRKDNESVRKRKKSLNIQEKLQRKFPNCSLSPATYCLCLRELKTVDHLFLHCDFTSKGRTVLLNPFGLDSCRPKKIDDWIMDGLNVSRSFLGHDEVFGGVNLVEMSRCTF